MAFDVKITTLFRPLDLLAPFTCRGCGVLGELLCGCCKKYNIKAIPKICPRCKAKRKDCKCEVPVVAVSKREGVLVDLTEDYKYKSIRKTSGVLAELMDEAIRKNTKLGSGVVVVPLPTISKHIRERGFDHTLLFAKKLAKRREGWKIRKLLVRRGRSVQVGADGDKRREQAKKAYEMNKMMLDKEGKVDSNKTYLLVDDVWTTGASMEAAIDLLEKAGAKKIVGAVVLMP